MTRFEPSGHVAAIALAVALAGTGHAAAETVIPSPFVVIDAGTADAPAVVSFREAYPLLHDLHGRGELVALTGFPLPGGEKVDLVLRSVRALEEGGTATVMHADGEEQIAPSVALFSGHVPGHAGTAFLAVSQTMMNGYLRLHDRLVMISSGPPDLDAIATIATGEQLGGAVDGASFCHLDETFILSPLGGGAKEELLAATPVIRVAPFFVELDHQYRTLFATNQQAIDYGATLLAAAMQIYRRDLGVDLQVPSGWLRLWTTPTPWATGDLLSLRQWWMSNANPLKDVTRGSVHLITQPVFGGVAMAVGGLCDKSMGYEVSSVYGTFPFPIQHQSVQNWDLMVVTHEYGHTFGSDHTFSYSPPIACVDGSGPDEGTIMSYCHANGMEKVGMRFHPTVQATIRTYLATSAPCVTFTPFAFGDYDLSGGLDASDLAAYDACASQGFESAGCLETFDFDGNGKLEGCDRKALVYLINGAAPSATTYGCTSPAGSLSVLSGEASLGSSITLGVDNPLGTQPAGSTPFLIVAATANAAFPCGAPVPGAGMAAPGAAGEWLTAGPVLVIAGAPWAGTGTPAPFAFPIPADCALLGVRAYVQGGIHDPSATNVETGLTDGLVIVLGP